MQRNIEDIISKCMLGKTAYNIIQEIEEELPDIKSILLDLRKDLKQISESAELKNEDKRIEIIVNKDLYESSKLELDFIADLYSRIYPEFEFFVTGDKDE